MDARLCLSMYVCCVAFVVGVFGNKQNATFPRTLIPDCTPVFLFLFCCFLLLFPVFLSVSISLSLCIYSMRDKRMGGKGECAGVGEGVMGAWEGWMGGGKGRG